MDFLFCKIYIFCKISDLLIYSYWEEYIAILKSPIVRHLISLNWRNCLPLVKNKSYCCKHAVDGSRQSIVSKSLYLARIPAVLDLFLFFNISYITIRKVDKRGCIQKYFLYFVTVSHLYIVLSIGMKHFSPLPCIFKSIFFFSGGFCVARIVTITSSPVCRFTSSLITIGFPL